MRRLTDIILAMMRDQAPYDAEIHRRKQKLHKEKGKRVAAAQAGDQALRFSSSRCLPFAILKEVCQTTFAAYSSTQYI